MIPADPTAPPPPGAPAPGVPAVTMNPAGIYADHLPVSAYAYVRARIGTAVADATIYVRLVGC